MWQLTIRDADASLAHRLRRMAQLEGVSLNKVVLHLLRKGVGMADPQAPLDVVGNSLDHLIGTWTEAEEAEFLRAIELFEQIDEALWE